MWMSSCLPSVVFFHLSLVMLSLLLCECHLVFPLLSFVILITCYVKFVPMWMSSCFPSIVLSYLSYVMLSLHVNVILFPLYCLLSYLSLVMLSLLLCECHGHCLSSFYCFCHLSSFYCLMSHLTLVTLSFSYVNVILSSLYCLFSYLSLVMLSLLLCECHLVFLLLSFVILITCYVKFAPMWMSSCFPSIVFCHTYHLLC